MRPLVYRFLFVPLLSIAAEAATLRVLPGPFRSGKAFVTCTFNGVKESCFLDTGSAMSLLADSDQFSDYPRLGTFKFKSASGIAEEVATIRIETANIDRVEFCNIEVGRVESKDGIESTVGVDLIGRQAFAVNFHDSPSLHLNARPPRQLLPGLKMEAHRLLSLPIAFGATGTRAMWDTGASVTAVDEGFVKAHAEDFKPTGDFMKGTDGAGRALLLQIFRAKKITLGPRTFRNVKVVVLDLALLREKVSPEMHAVIGFNVIRRTDWFFDPQQKTWSVR
jgi:hypothetical protein